MMKGRYLAACGPARPNHGNNITTENAAIRREHASRKLWAPACQECPAAHQTRNCATGGQTDGIKFTSKLVPLPTRGSPSRVGHVRSENWSTCRTQPGVAATMPLAMRPNRLHGSAQGTHGAGLYSRALLQEILVLHDAHDAPVSGHSHWPSHAQP